MDMSVYWEPLGTFGFQYFIAWVVTGQSLETPLYKRTN
jgi:hypothetical protein